MRPSKIAIYIWAIIALLAVICMFVPRDGWYLDKLHLRWPTMEHMLGIEVKNDSIQKLTDTITVQKIDTTGLNLQVKDTVQQQQLATIIEDLGTRIYLHAFYQSLDSAQWMPIRVVHFGDSQIEEDRMTNVLREYLQELYGGSGPGLLPLHQTIPTSTTRQRLYINDLLQSTSEGPMRYGVYGKYTRLPDNDYGVMGQVAMMDNNILPGSEHLRLTIEPFSSPAKNANYFNRVRLLSQNVNGYIMAQGTTISLPSNQLVEMPQSTSHCEIQLQGQGKVYGISLESDHGVIVDNIPMRACSGDIFTRIDSATLKEYFANTNTRLIILQYGGNSIKNSSAGIASYVKRLRAQVQYLRQCAPLASILFIGPSDMTTRIEGEYTSFPMLPYMDKLMEQMAREEKIGYWSLYHAMGGKNSMITWKEKGLSGNDGIHFTKKGARKAGQMLTKWIDEGNIFKK